MPLPGAAMGRQHSGAMLQQEGGAPDGLEGFCGRLVGQAVQLVALQGTHSVSQYTAGGACSRAEQLAESGRTRGGTTVVLPMMATCWNMQAPMMRGRMATRTSASFQPAMKAMMNLLSRGSVTLRHDRPHAGTATQTRAHPAMKVTRFWAMRPSWSPAHPALHQRPGCSGAAASRPP